MIFFLLIILGFSYLNSFFDTFFYDCSDLMDLNFQDGSSILCNNLIFFHDNIMFFILLLLIFVLSLLLNVIINKYYNKNLVDNTLIELIWTSFPAIILLLIVVPSLKLLYMLDENISISLNIKVIGHQWYWSYEYPNWFNELSFDSYMLSSEDLQLGDMRLLEVDNKLLIPCNTMTRFVITSQDVIHCFVVPSLNIKADAIPGKLNQVIMSCNRIGNFYGQCSEICGSDHAFMPINIQSVPVSKFLSLL